MRTIANTITISLLILIGMATRATAQQSSPNTEQEAAHSLLERDRKLLEQLKQQLPTLSHGEAANRYFEIWHLVGSHEQLRNLIPLFIEKYRAVEGDTSKLAANDVAMLAMLESYDAYMGYDHVRESYGLDNVMLDYSIGQQIVDISYPYLPTDLQQFIKLGNELPIENYDRDGLLVSLEELGDRIALREHIAANTTYPQLIGSLNSNCEYMLSQMLFCTQENSRTFDTYHNLTKRIEPEVKKDIEAFVLKHPTTKAADVVRYYLKLLKKYNDTYSPEFEEKVMKAARKAYP